MSAKRRAALFAAIRECAVAIGVEQAEVAEFELLNVYWAAIIARQRAVDALVPTPAQVLVDGKRQITGVRLPQTPVIEGRSAAVIDAAASIIAKGTRDRMMERTGLGSSSLWFRAAQGLLHVEASNGISAV